MSIEGAAARTRAYLAGNVRDYSPTGQAMMDVMAIVQAYLAEHLPDDREPLDAEWLKAQGSDRLAGDAILMKCRDLDMRPAEAWLLLVDLDSGRHHVTLRDRGDYRRLVRALKLEES